MQVDKLKPCPFCGKRARRMKSLDSIELRHHGANMFYFGCPTCDMVMSICARTEAKDIEAWNTRAEGYNDAD